MTLSNVFVKHFSSEIWWHHFRDISQNAYSSEEKNTNNFCCRYDFGRKKNLNNMTWWSRFFNIPIDDDDVCSIRFFWSFISNFIQEISRINAIVLCSIKKSWKNFMALNGVFKFSPFNTFSRFIRIALFAFMSLLTWASVCSCVCVWASYAFQFLCLLFINRTN